MIVRIEYTATAISPLHHGGNEKTGNLSMLRRLPFLVGDSPIEIPYIDGNAVRGRLRRLMARDLLYRMEYNPRTDVLYHLLMSGGALEDAGERTGQLSVERNKRIRSLLPMISLFGASYLNQALPGKMFVGHMLPYCSELVVGGYLDRLDGVALRSIGELLPWTHGTRRDDREVASENVQQMLFEYEVFMPGTVFVGDFVLRYPSALELSAFAHLLHLWAQFPTVGAREAQGHARLRLQMKEPLQETAERYLAFLQEKRDEIRALLEELDAIRTTTHKNKDAGAIPSQPPLAS